VADGTGGLVCSSYAGDVLRVEISSGQIETVGRGMPGLAVSDSLAGVFIAETRLGTDGRIDRRRQGLSWHRRDNEWTAVPDGCLGPIWSVAHRHGWTATAYPHADTVIVRVEGLPAWHVAAYYPTGVAWAGRSLVVTNVDGEVLLFDKLTDALGRRAY
jgi:hypothetical protein